MILINLLPHREAARKKRQDVFNVSLGLSALVGGVISGAIFLWLQTQISSQENLNNILTVENKRLDDQIKDIAVLEAEIAALRARQQAVEDLQSDRNMPVYLLTELSKQIPDGVYITALRQDGQTIALTGTAQSQERVSEFLRHLAYESAWFSKPELIEIISGSIAVGKEQRRVSNFSMRVRMLRASELTRPQATTPANSPVTP